ncbi:MAG: patatin-like phospholipase family protein [Pseudomonadota bacterium]
MSSHEAAGALHSIQAKYGRRVQGQLVARHNLDRFFWLQFHKTQEGEATYTFCPSNRRSSEGTPENFRLCNLVLQGGGTLGLAHAGFITGLEAAGIRFAGLAGTSAGSILAMAIAAIRGADLETATNEKLVRLSQSVPMDQFIDGPRPVRVTIKRALQGRPLYLPQYWMGCLAAFRRLKRRRGLNQGEVFESWLNDVLAAEGFASIKDLSNTLQEVWQRLGPLRDPSQIDFFSEPLLKHENTSRDGQNTDSGDEGLALLKLVTTAMPVGMKFHLPEHLKFLAPEYASTSPARLVRTSMSVPLFFEPVEMRTNPQTWGQFVQDDMADLMSDGIRDSFLQRERITFLDGGLLSNLPSDAFRNMMPEVPTVVVPLVSGGEPERLPKANSTAGLLGDVGACATAVRLQRDREMVLDMGRERRDFKQRVGTNNRAGRDAGQFMGDNVVRRKFPTALAPIDTGDINWLNFVMSDGEKSQLFTAGLTRAQAFLDDLNAE